MFNLFKVERVLNSPGVDGSIPTRVMLLLMVRLGVTVCEIKPIVMMLSVKIRCTPATCGEVYGEAVTFRVK